MADARRELGVLLRRLRNDARLSGARAAEHTGLSQASISRWEQGRFAPTLTDARALLRLYRAAPDDVDRVEEMVTDLREPETRPARLTMRRSGDMQARVRRLEARSTLVRTFQPVIFGGLLQTPEYMRAVFRSGGDLSVEEIEEGVAGRMERAASLGSGAFTYVAVHPEGVARWPIGGLDVLRRQINHVIDVSHWPGVHVGIVPSDRAVAVAPMHAFDVYDERVALVGTETATAFLTDSRDVAAYLKLFSDLQSAATFGDQARVVLHDIAKMYR